MKKKLEHIIEFYGETCPHCVSMRPIIQQLEDELEVEITKLEVWQNPENEKIMAQYSDIIGEACGGYAGVPAFVNTQTHQALCGVQEEAILRAFMQGEDCKDGVCQPHSDMRGKESHPS